MTPSITTKVSPARYGTPMKLTERFAYDPDDTAELRAEKFAIFLVALSCSLAGCIWSAMYFVIFGATIIALLPLLFVAGESGDFFTQQSPVLGSPHPMPPYVA